MGTVTLEQAKAHLRLTDTAQDTILQVYMRAADDYIAQFLNVPTPPNNPSVQAAALLTIGDLFENREGAGEKTIVENPAVVRLLFPYRKNMGI